jgi:hypothetical protein
MFPLNSSTYVIDEQCLQAFILLLVFKKNICFFSEDITFTNMCNILRDKFDKKESYHNDKYSITALKMT